MVNHQALPFRAYFYLQKHLELTICFANVRTSNSKINLQCNASNEIWILHKAVAFYSCYNKQQQKQFQEMLVFQT